jgi:SAM-dependent methyltransferase
MAGDLKAYAPQHGIDCSPEYVRGYHDSHVKPETVEYRLSYLPMIALDGLLRDYSILDIGCGTAGYYRLARNVRAITGVDYSQRMLDSALELAKRYGYAGKVRFIKASFDEFEGKETYDAIRAGVYGSYEPINAALLARLHAMLNPGGFLVVGVSPPRGWRQKLRDSLNLPVNKMSEAKFERLASRSGGLAIAARIRVSSRTYYCLQDVR